MSLLTSVNQSAPADYYFVENSGTAANPIIPGTSVQVATNGLVVDTSASPAILMYSPSSVPGSYIRVGTQGVNLNQLQVGPTNEVFLNCTTVASGNVQMNPGTRIEMFPPAGALAGAVMDFNSLSAQGNVLTVGVALPTPIADGATVAIPNPVPITGVDGLYAVTLRGAPGDGQEARMNSTVAIWNGGLWVSGGVGISESGGFITRITPNAARTTLQVINNSGAALTGLVCDFTLLARFNA